MVLITRESIRDILKANLLHELHITIDRIHLFKEKYRVEFVDFEKAVSEDVREDFQKWDDYIEWKACERSAVELTSEINDLKNENYSMS